MWVYYYVDSKKQLWKNQKVLIVFSQIEPIKHKHFIRDFDLCLYYRNIDNIYPQIIIYQACAIMEFNTECIELVTSYVYTVEFVPLLIFCPLVMKEESSLDKLKYLVNIWPNKGLFEISEYVNDFLKIVFKPVSISHTFYILWNVYFENNVYFNPLLPKKDNVKKKLTTQTIQTMEENNINKEQWNGRNFKSIIPNFKCKNILKEIPAEKLSDGSILCFIHCT